MTKPQFDSNSDDVSALFGGGGESQLGGVVSSGGRRKAVYIHFQGIGEDTTTISFDPTK